MKKKFLLLVLLVVFISHSLFALVIHVPTNYTTIQAAINSAAIGDTVLVDTGIYNENIDFIGKNIVVASHFITTQDTSAILQTIVHGTSDGSVVTFTSSETPAALLCGFTIRNGSTNNYGGGVNINSASPTLSYCIIEDNNALYGGGICCNNSSSQISYVQLYDNLAIGGGAVSLIDANPTFRRAMICNNGAELGGGFHCDNSSPEIVNSTFCGNSAFDEGGALYGYGSSPDFQNSIFCYNEGNYAVYLWSGSPTVSYSSFWNNELGPVHGFNDSVCVNVTTNVNGDSCDVYGNIQRNAKLLHVSDNIYCLSGFSPCINAGDPASPDDPDGTICDMGQIYFDRSYIEIDSFAVNKVDNNIRLTWGSLWETDVIGFNIYRTETDDYSLAEKINAAIIPGSGTTTVPQNYLYNDMTGIINIDYYYWLEVLNFADMLNVFGSIFYTMPVSVDDPEIPSDLYYSLSCTPNPFSGSIHIQFTYSQNHPNNELQNESVKIDIYNTKGQLVRTLPIQSATGSSFSATWDSRNESDQLVGSGVYYCFVRTGEKQLIKKLLLIR